MHNPLIGKFNTPFESTPFSRIEEKHFLPALEHAVAAARDQVDAIVQQADRPNFENTIVALDFTGQEVSRIAEIFFNLNSAETNDEIQQIARDFSPILTEYSNDVLLNEELFARIKSVWENRKDENLNTEQFRLLEKTYKSFVRNGANLNNADKARLRELNTKLATLSLQFGENVLAATNSYELVIDNEADLIGLPPFAVEAAAEEAQSRGYDGKWVITLDAPSYVPFMTYASNRDLREKLAKAFGSRAYKKEENDNRETVKQLAKLRKERAIVLGYDSHAAFVLEERMAEAPHKVNDFLEELYTYARPAAEKDLEAVKLFALETDGLSEFRQWDLSYYAEKLKKARFEIDDELLKPYFKLEQVIDGVFEVANKLYGISFKKRADIDKYHPDVITYEVLDKDGSHLALFYADFFPRKGKRNGAWMTSYRGQWRENGENKRPHISIVCNFTKPTASTPSLLTFREVTTLFHEFGHALHGILANTTYPSLSGTNVYWDFVELPSQVLENWCYEKECLDLFAHHYKTGDLIPEDYVQRLKDSATFNEGYATLRQLSFGMLDMAWHDQVNDEIEDVGEFENMAIAKTQLFEPIKTSNASCAFSHIFQGGYSAGYYSYKWAEVLDADAFELFREKGLFDQDTASKFRALLAAGGTEHPMELYKRFRSHEPDVKALLRRAGLIEE
jgi:Zn-dependent oligopeptidase